MLSRRELIAAGVAGSLAASPSGAVPVSAAEQEADRAGQREIARAVAGVEEVLRDAHLSSSLSHGFVDPLRRAMTQFFRANAKFPDFIEIGVGVFMDIYDWHIKHGQQLIVTRGADQRYHMQFMFSTLVLRAEQDAGHIGVPYDKG